jgi:hypothetical protein
MEAQQIRTNINELVNGIQDEAFLSACFEAVQGISNAYIRVNENTNGKDTLVKSATKKTKNTKKSLDLDKSQPHDLSLVLLANEIFKGSETAPQEVSIAFRRALMRTAKRYEPQVLIRDEDILLAT